MVVAVVTEEGQMTADEERRCVNGIERKRETRGEGGEEEEEGG